MGCTWSGLHALYDVVNPGGSDIFIGNRHFKIIQQLGEGGYAFVYLVKEQTSDISSTSSPANLSPDGQYAVKKVLVQSQEQLQLVKAEINAQQRFHHPNLLPLLDHAIIPAPGRGLSQGGSSSQGGGGGQEAYLLFPVHREGTLQDMLDWKEQKQRLSPFQVLHIFGQICAGLQHMHSHNPPYAHNDIKPANVLVTRKGGAHVSAVIMDFGSTRAARHNIQSRSAALELQEWAAQHCTAPYRAPELWDCPSQVEIDERVDIWALGCTFFALMYGQNPFEYSLGEAGGSLQLAAMSGQVKWPAPSNPPYPESFHSLVTWMLQTNIALRPSVGDVCLHVERLMAKLPPAVLPPSFEDGAR
eukprot:jgi/Mesen1/4116/ME000216S03371